MRETKLAIYAFITSLAVLVAAGAYGIYSNQQQNTDLRDSQVSACQASLKPGGVRYIVAQQIRVSLQQAKHFDYSTFFPNVPKDQLNALIQQSQDRQREEIRDLLSVNCESQYHR